MKYAFFPIVLAALSVFSSGQVVAEPSKADLKNIVYLDTRFGRVAIKLLPKLTPKHVARIKKLTREGFYNGVKFHRVIEGFMAQTGDPTGTGAGGSKYPNVEAEFGQLPFRRGTVGAGRKGNDLNSFNSQFFICFQDTPTLNGNYTAFGTVITGMEHIDRINRGEPPAFPDTIVKMQMASDAEDHSVLEGVDD